jgi:ATP-dependent Lhr-like helicase
MWGGDSLSWAHPLVRDWFLARFGGPTEPQQAGWPQILARRPTLIAAPTGSGKTLTAFLACIDRLVRQALAGDLRDCTEVLYVSPLKALGNDIQKNLEVPLGEILQLAGTRGLLMPEIRTAVRTGDTLPKERRAMLKRPPHILVTTPESLYILLTADASRQLLRHVDTVIVDEIHAVAGDKRGAHLALSLERLDSLITESGRAKPVRIGLSATQKPIEQIAEFLSPPVIASKDVTQSPVISSENAAQCSVIPSEDEPRHEASPSRGTFCFPPSNTERIAIVDVGHKRTLDLKLEVPRSALGPICTNEMWDEMYERIVQLVQEHRSTLLFVNTRRLAERIALHLGERLGVDKVAAHHGSLARKLRLDAENRLKNGQLRVLVATASLQLGIDVGHVDLVVQISSPRSIAVALQRIGRAGHWRGAIPKGRLFATTRDDLVELAALTRAIAEDDLDRILIPEAPLDILAQQIVAECASRTGAVSVRAVSGHSFSRAAKSSDDCHPERGPAEERGESESRDLLFPGHDSCSEDALFHLVRRAYPYRNLSREEFDSVVTMLSEGISARRGRYGAYLHRDAVYRKLRARRGARLTAITSGGAIPETALYAVVASPEGTVVGTVDEDFAVESLAGDIFLLGNTSWRIQRVESKFGRILVEDAQGAPPNIPFWRGEAPARTAELSHRVGELMETVSAMVPKDHEACRALALGAANWAALQIDPEISAAIDWLKANCGLDDPGAEQLIEYVIAGRAVLGAVPTPQTIIAERFFDEGGGMQLILHAPFGGRVNKAWGLSLRKRFCRSFNFELQAAATDNGLNIALAEQHSFPLADVFQFLQAETVADVLQQAVLTGSPIFGTRFRWDANRALALLRYRGGKKVPAPIQRIQADDLLASVFPDVAACQENIDGDIKVPDHPLVREVMKDVMHEAMDIDGLIAVLRGIQDGSIRCIAVDTPVPSAFSHEILNANPYAYLDDAPLEERRARAVEMRRVLPESVLEEVGKLDPAAIEQVQQEAWPDIRDEEELHDALMTLIAFPSECRPETLPERRPALAAEGLSAHWEVLFAKLLRVGRVGAAQVGDQNFWFAAERAAQFSAIYPSATFVTDQTGNWRRATDNCISGDCLLQMLTGWMQHLGPTSAPELAALLSLPENEIEQTLLRLESTGAILRGTFRNIPAVIPSEDASGVESKLGAVTPGENASRVENELDAVIPSEDARENQPPRFWAAGSRIRIEEPASPTRPLEFCDRRLLARIHRLTLGALRKEIEPVTQAQFMRWLLRWQHLAPGTQARGEHGVLEVLKQLQGFELAANAWERDVFARRLADYDSSDLDQLCLTGAVGWGRLSPHPATLEANSGGPPKPPLLRWGTARRIIPTSVAPITFFVRADCDWMQPHDLTEEERSLSDTARQVLTLLRQRGALFLADLLKTLPESQQPRADSRDRKRELESALWELVAAGLVTADAFENLRALIGNRRPQTGPLRVRKHQTAGRWSLIHAYETERSRAVQATCRVLLSRYGVVFRELLAREAIAIPWRELAQTLRRMEDRGEVRGGRFVHGFIGEQFALPLAVESLRAMRRVEPNGETITISAADPLNLVGIIVPGERVPAISGRTVTYRDGVAVPAGSSAALAGD